MSPSSAPFSLCAAAGVCCCHQLPKPTFYPSLQLLTSVFSFLCSFLSSCCCRSSPDGEDTTITGIQSNLRYKKGPYLADKDVRIVRPQILPTPSEITKNFFTGFVPLEVTRDDKIKKLERDLVRVVAIKKDSRVVENDLEPSRALVEFGVVGGDATTPNFGVNGGGGGYSPNVGGDFGGADGGGGEGFSPINEEVRCPPETPFTRENLLMLVPIPLRSLLFL
ncbi:hypothetical protein HAX54_019410 [Datura stramonium]|uniref:Uncharacterized protein n=1 Tax=Datura stramonium TaxID=4076 RepID=A0ABS8URF2_DATST|nr:hypothetical protein [Datura stramonium]